MEKIILDYIQVRKNIVEYHYTIGEGLNKYFTTDCMYLEYEEDVSSVPLSMLTIPFVNCMAGISWLSNSAIFVDEIDATYYDSFKTLKTAYNELHNYIGLKGLLIPSRIVTNEISKSESGLLLFGGGVDCHSSFIRNKAKITHILNIFGWLNDLNEISDMDINDKKQTSLYAQKMGVKALHVRSNYATCFNHKIIEKDFHVSYWYGFLHSMAFLSIAVPLAWCYNIPVLYIASSFTKGEYVGCASFITTDTEFKFAKNGETIHDGFELNRQGKVKILVDYQRESNEPYYIQVCNQKNYNCCVCEKCFRTVLALVAEGADVKDFGFCLEKPLKEHWNNVMIRYSGLMSFIFGQTMFWVPIKSRMKENYKKMTKEQQEVVDWFLTADFSKVQQKSRIRYYFQNFFSIIRRKLGFNT